MDACPQAASSPEQPSCTVRLTVPWTCTERRGCERVLHRQAEPVVADDDPFVADGGAGDLGETRRTTLNSAPAVRIIIS